MFCAPVEVFGLGVFLYSLLKLCCRFVFRAPVEVVVFVFFVTPLGSCGVVVRCALVKVFEVGVVCFPVDSFGLCVSCARVEDLLDLSWSTLPGDRGRLRAPYFFPGRRRERYSECAGLPQLSCGILC